MAQLIQARNDSHIISPGHAPNAPLIQAAAPHPIQFRVTGDNPNERPDDRSVWNERTGQWERGTVAYSNWQGEQDVQRREEAWESRYSFGQRERISEINEAIDAVQNDDSLSAAQKQDALNQLKGKLYGIKPLETPPEEPPKIPEPVFHGENNELMWDPAKGTWIANPALGSKGGKGAAVGGGTQYTEKDIDDSIKRLTRPPDPETGEKGWVPDLNNPEDWAKVQQDIRIRRSRLGQLNGEPVNIPGRKNEKGEEVPATVPEGAEKWAAPAAPAPAPQGGAQGGGSVPVFGVDNSKPSPKPQPKQSAQPSTTAKTPAPSSKRGRISATVRGKTVTGTADEVGEFIKSKGLFVPGVDVPDPVGFRENMEKNAPTDPNERVSWINVELHKAYKSLKKLKEGSEEYNDLADGILFYRQELERAKGK